MIQYLPHRNLVNFDWRGEQDWMVSLMMRGDHEEHDDDDDDDDDDDHIEDVEGLVNCE
jgi:hypothetical protein